MATLMASPWYLLAVAVLLLNDHVLKGAFPGFVTGKLSDFAGLFAFAAFWASLFPRRALAACAAAGGLFVLWKSPWAEPLIALWNARGPFEVARVADLTDLAALAVLPLAYRLSLRPPGPSRRPLATAGVAVLSLVAFAATSVPHYNFQVPPDDPLRRIEFQGSARQLAKKLEGCGQTAHLRSGRALGEPGINYLDLALSERAGPGRRSGRRNFLVSAVLRGEAGRLILDFEDATVFRPQGPVDEAAALRQVERKIRACLGP